MNILNILRQIPELVQRLRGLGIPLSTVSALLRQVADLIDVLDRISPSAMKAAFAPDLATTAASAPDPTPNTEPPTKAPLD